MLPEIYPALVRKPPKSEFVDLFLQLCSDPLWLLERKLDGYRCMVVYDKPQLKLMTKLGKNHTLPKEFSRLLVGLLSGCGISNVVLDCELVGFNRAGLEDFGSIKKTGCRRKLFAFDLPLIENTDLRAVPLLERKNYLQTALNVLDGNAELICSVPYTADTTGKLQQALQVFSSDQEGVVLKHSQGLYPDLLNPWYKFKNKDYSQYRERWRMFQKKIGRNS